MKTKTKLLSCLLSVLCYLPMQGQVTIGDGIAPQDFSVLEVSTKDTKGGLRLPQLTTDQRNAWRDYFLGTATGNPVKPSGSVTADEIANAPGLAIFNTDTKCYEYWNSTRWVSLCEGNSLMVISPEPCQNVAADGTGCDQEFTVTDPDCLNGPFTILIVAGQDYAQLTGVNETDGLFGLSFQPNNSVNRRSVVVRVTSSCTGLYKDFLFLQDGYDCSTGNLGTAPEINSVPPGKTITFCAGGAVYLSIDATTITAPATLADVIWTRNNIEVARGVNNIVVTQDGKYDVWMGYIGCGQRPNNTVTVTREGIDAPQPVNIVVNGNNGMVCGPTGKTTLVAMNPNASGTVLWFKNGVLASEGSDYTVITTDPSYVRIEVGTGDWFAVVTDGTTCYSRPSETVSVIENPESGGSLTVPVIEPGGSFCAGGTVPLSVSPGSLNTSYTYTWYANNTQIGAGSSVLYTVPSGISYVVIRCRATLTGSCAREAIAVETITTGTIPQRPDILPANAVLCNGSRTLTAVTQTTGNIRYDWYKDNAKIAEDAQTLTITSGGDYYVTATEVDGCTSPMAHISIPLNSSASPIVDFTSSAPVPGVANAGDRITYRASINFGPALSYTWSTLNATIVDGGGLNDDYAVVVYGTAGSPAYVQVVVTNACGAGTGHRDVANVGSNCEEADLGTLSPDIDQNKPNERVGVDFTLGPVDVSFGSSGKTYEWYRNTIKSTSGATLLTGTGMNSNNPPYRESTAGTYYYYCVMTNSQNCDALPVQSPFYTVTVSANPADMARGSGTLSGKTCFDINKSNWTGDCGTQSGRASAAINFAQLGAVTYTFTASASGDKSDLRFLVVDPLGCVVSYTGGKSGTINNNEVINLTVNYKTTLSNNDDIIYGRTRNNAARVTIYAVYNDGANDVSVPLEVKIQDCVCCGAYVASGQWKTFMCHNLGADETLDPFTPAKGLNGNYYQWGRKPVVATVATGPATISGWNTSSASNSAWSDGSKTNNDPCPAGYRVPTRAQWQGVTNTSLNSQTWVGTWTNNAANFGSGINYGPGLYLSAAGARGYADGLLNMRGMIGYYWSSSYNINNESHILYMTGTKAQIGSVRGTNGLSVRCIAE
jgi:uncharacterized protein (TIGR02145 family)